MGIPMRWKILIALPCMPQINYRRIEKMILRDKRNESLTIAAQ